MEYFIRKWLNPKTILLALLAETPQEKYRWRYLVSPRWFVVRNLSMYRWRSRCRKCGKMASDVHHETYAGKNMAGWLGMAVEVLTTRPLCRKCHNEEHKKK